MTQGIAMLRTNDSYHMVDGLHQFLADENRKLNEVTLFDKGNLKYLLLYLDSITY